MKQIFVRTAGPDDADKFANWAAQNPAMDARSLVYPSSFTLVAYDDSGPLSFLPVQQPFYMEAMSFRPDATESEKALAMKELTHALITFCHQKGAGEIYFMGSNEHTNAFAERQGFSELPWRTFRVRLHELEGLNEK
jgi:hypothetical protein